MGARGAWGGGGVTGRHSRLWRETFRTSEGGANPTDNVSDPPPPKLRPQPVHTIPPHAYLRGSYSLPLILPLHTVHTYSTYIHTLHTYILHTYIHTSGYLSIYLSTFPPPRIGSFPVHLVSADLSPTPYSSGKPQKGKKKKRKRKRKEPVLASVRRGRAGRSM